MSTNPLNYLRTDYGTDRKDINKIISELNDIYAPAVENTGLKYGVKLHIPRRKRSTTVTTGDPTRKVSHTRDRSALEGIRRLVPTTVSSYPLIHTITGTESCPALTDGKFGCLGKFDGSSYITITTDSLLNPTTEIGISLWVYSPATSADGFIVVKDTQYELKFTSGNGVSWRTYSGGAWRTALTTTFTPNTWTHIAATYKSSGSGQILYKDGVSVASDSLTGAIGTSSNDLGIGSSAGTGIIVSGTRFALLSMVQNEMSSAWIGNHKDGLLDMRTYTEITTIPFAGNWDPQPNMTSPYFLSS